MADLVRRTLTRGVRSLSYLDSDPTDTQRPVILLIHGFPDEAAMWGPVAARLHAEGFRVLALDTIGCGHSAIGNSLRDYHLDEVLADLLALLDKAGATQADVVGHDWGAGIAWFLAMRHAKRVRTLTAVSVGHPAAFLRGGLRQKLLSWYILYFHLAPLADWLLPGDGPLGLRRVFASHPEMDSVMARLREPGRMQAAVRIYRANIITQVVLARHPRGTVPTLAIHSRGDRFLVERQIAKTREWVDAPFHHEELDGGHWIPLEQPDRLANLIRAHVTRGVLPA